MWFWEQVNFQGRWTTRAGAERPENRVGDHRKRSIRSVRAIAPEHHNLKLDRLHEIYGDQNQKEAHDE